MLKKILLFLLTISVSCTSNGVYVECESFDKGGWSLDVQSSDILGTPYLIAHGIGSPVKDAETTISLPDIGLWNIYVKTYNWTSPWFDGKGPGKFQILVDGKQVGNDTLGCTLAKWGWEYAGEFYAERKDIKLSLHDITGFDARADAIYISKSKDFDVPEAPIQKVSRTENFDFVVVGGGIAGICASISAARLGLKVALINDYNLLGGNNSSLVRVHLGGKICKDPYPSLGNLLKEFGHSRPGNAMPEQYYEDWKKDSIIQSEKNITLYTPYHFIEAKTSFGSIRSIVIRHNETGERINLKSPFFCDCTGDATLGVSAGADFRYGRESFEESKERSAPMLPDSLIMGGSIQWNTEICDSSAFEFNYGLQFNDQSVQILTKGDWMWETGMNRDMIKDVERIRDYGMLVAYSNWSYLKNKLDLFKDRKLSWVSYVLGKRESRRLLGDIILNEEDIKERKVYTDASVTTTWSIDLHYPDPENTKFFPNEEFKSICTQTPIEPYPIPYRCFYSRNINNLFMAGRDISVTHIALGTTRVMRTCAMMGEVVGMAASLCKKYDILPRDIYTYRLDELKQLMTKGVGRTDVPNNQNFN